MRIGRIELLSERLPLARPYTIARQTIAEVELLFVRVEAGGACGLGCASPAVEVTGESPQACRAALEAAATLLAGADPRRIGSLVRRLETELPAAPAARAACDMALWDLVGRLADQPVVELFGRCHETLPTSVTVGIQADEEAVEEAREHVGRGFRVLKVKLGRDVERDLERLRRIRAAVGPSIVLRTDANAGYGSAELRRYLAGTRGLAIELCEQPLARGDEAGLAGLPARVRARLAADESVLDLADAGRLAPSGAYGIFNLKLMKCGGISPARRIAHLAEGSGIALMWGCNDESRISIAAALHAAFASPATRYLDLDGSFDLARDLVEGGFELVDGALATAAGAGLGLRWIG